MAPKIKRFLAKKLSANFSSSRNNVFAKLGFSRLCKHKLLLNWLVLVVLGVH